MISSNNYILKNVTIIDGTGNPPVENSWIHIHFGKIYKIGSMNNFNINRSMNPDIFDLTGKYIMPGMIDAHIHMAGGRGDGTWGDTEILCEPILVRAMRSVYEAQKMLQYGFTTLRDISVNGLYLKRVFNDNTFPGPKVIACGPGLARTGGHCDSPQLDLDYVKSHHFWAIISDGADECRKNVRKVLREGADQIKFWATGGGNWGTDRITDTHYSFEEMKTICDEAHMVKGTLVCAHCETEESIRMAIEAGADTIEHGEALTEELADIMVKKGIVLVPTLYLLANWYDLIETPGVGTEKLIRPDPFLHRDIGTVFSEKEKEKYMKSVVDSFKIALKKGVIIALGSDTVYEPACEYGRQSLFEFKELVKRGMPLLEAIKAATYNGAIACAMQHRIGAIKEGFDADYLILDKNPAETVDILANNKNIKQVVLSGKTVVVDGKLIW